MRHTLFKGCKSKDGQIEIIDSDSLCYIVKNNEVGKITQRIISRELLNEYVNYFEKNPNNGASEARNELCRKTHIDIANKAQVNMYATGLHEVGSSVVEHYSMLEINDLFMLLCVAFNQTRYRVDKRLNVILLNTSNIDTKN